MAEKLKYYDELKEVYLSAFKSNVDKAKNFRSIMEACADELETSVAFKGQQHTPLKTKVDAYLKARKYPSEIVKLVHQLLSTLNPYAHDRDPITGERICLSSKDEALSDSDLRSIFAQVVGVLYIFTDVMPSESIQVLMNSVDELDGLTDEQKDAVVDKSQIIYVNAGPGTGKTFLLIRKIAQYIRQSTTEEKIVAISYTNTAANELCTKFYNSYSALHIEKSFQFMSGTIHSFCYKLMAKYSSDILQSPFKYIIVDDTELDELCEEIHAILEGKYTEEEIYKCLRAKEEFENKEIENAVNYIKTTYSIITINEILLKFIEYLRNPQFSSWIKEQISILMIDEAQDLSAMNYQIIEMLLENNPSLKIFLVGDPRQNIFKFIGGSYQHLNDFLAKYEGRISRKNLTISFRCPQKVFDFTNTMTFIDCSNVPLHSRSEDQNGYFIVRSYGDTSEESQKVITLVNGINDYKKTAILAKSLKYLEEVVHGLNDNKIPFKVFGGSKFLVPHVRVLNHLFRILESDNSYSIKYVWDKFKLPKPAGVKTWGEVLYNGEYNTIGDIIVSCRHKFESGIFSLSDCLITLSNIVLDFIRDGELDKQAREDFPKLEKLIADYTTIQEYLLSFAIDKDKYVDFYKRDLDVECLTSFLDDFVTISTIHSAKGLEWDNVIISGMSEGIFPNPYFCDDKHSAEKTQENYNDELKNLFVAVTRTKKNLYMTYPRVKIVKKGMNVYRFDMSKSRFIKNLPNN